MLVELGHRVRNDLARLTSLLRVQAAAAGPEAAEALRAAAERASVVGRLHDRLVRREGDVAVDAREFLVGLVEDFSASLGGLRPVGLFVEAEPHALPLPCASAVGLVANEFVTNGLKHAFPGERAGAISVTFRREGTDYVLTVADDGVGIGAGEPVRQPGSTPGGMGGRLVRALAAQCGGRIDTLPQVPRGTLHVLRFPLPRAAGSDARYDVRGEGRSSLAVRPEAA